MTMEAKGQKQHHNAVARTRWKGGQRLTQIFYQFVLMIFLSFLVARAKNLQMPMLDVFSHSERTCPNCFPSHVPLCHLQKSVAKKFMAQWPNGGLGLFSKTWCAVVVVVVPPLHDPRSSPKWVCFGVRFGTCFSSSRKKRRVCFRVCFGGVFRQSRTSSST